MAQPRNRAREAARTIGGHLPAGQTRHWPTSRITINRPGWRRKARLDASKQQSSKAALEHRNKHRYAGKNQRTLCNRISLNDLPKFFYFIVRRASFVGQVGSLAQNADEKLFLGARQPPNDNSKELGGN
jgi:hypothetical protein